MSNGKQNTRGDQNTNYTWQKNVLKLLQGIKDTIANAVQYAEQDFGAVTGATVTLAYIPTKIYGVFKNGQRLTNGTDYSISGTVVTFVNPLVADLITVTYNY